MKELLKLQVNKFWHLKKWIASKKILTLFKMGEEWAKASLTRISPVTSLKVDIGPQNFLTFSFNPFATPIKNLRPNLVPFPNY